MQIITLVDDELIDAFVAKDDPEIDALLKEYGL
jgi:hypothetical protein